MSIYHPKAINVALRTRCWSMVRQQCSSASQAEHLRKLKADFIVCLNGQNRLSYLNKLKAQISAGLYQVDSHTLARKLVERNRALFMQELKEPPC